MHQFHYIEEEQNRATKLQDALRERGHDFDLSECHKFLYPTPQTKEFAKQVRKLSVELNREAFKMHLLKLALKGKKHKPIKRK